MKGQITSSAHSALEYIISKAMLEGKIGQTILEIPMTDIFSEYEGPKFHADASSLVLRLTINTTWAEGSPEGDFETDIEGELDFEEGLITDEEEDDDGLN